MINIPCDGEGLMMMLGSLDPFQKVLNVPCWQAFMWETILSYGSSYNEKELLRIGQAIFQLETRYRDASAHGPLLYFRSA